MIQKGELFLWYREECKGKKGNQRQTELWFPLRVVSHEHEGGTEREKKRETILGWLPWQHNKQKGAGTCRDVSIAVPCVCMDKYHMPQNSL